MLRKLNNMKNSTNQNYILNDFEIQIINESLSDYENGNIISNEDVFSKTKKWLEE